MNGVKHTGAGAVPIAQAAEGAGGGTAGNRSGSRAGLDAVIVKTDAAVAVAAVAVHNGMEGRAAGGLSTHDGADGLGGLCTAGGALVDGRAALHNGFGVIGTAGIAAAAAVGAGQAVGNLGNAGVLVHGHKLGGQNQNHAAGQTQQSQHDDGEDNIIHTILPLTPMRR